MMAVYEKVMTLKEFEEYVRRTENQDQLFELIQGQLVEVLIRAPYYSAISNHLVYRVHLFCREHGIVFHTSGADGAYRIGNHVVAPDFSFKRAPMSNEVFDPIPPEWAVEVIAPSDRAFAVRGKRDIYREANILAWEIYPQFGVVDVYAPGRAPRSVGIDGVLDGGDVLPGFTLAVKELFPKA